LLPEWSPIPTVLTTVLIVRCFNMMFFPIYVPYKENQSCVKF